MPFNVTEPRTQTITIQSKQFEVPIRYQAGTVELSEGEANALNQTYAENVRNNFAALMKRAAEDEQNPRELTQEDLDSYVESYTFGVRGSGGPRASSDPVGTEERRLALVAVKAAVARAQKVWKDIPEEQQKALVERAVATGKFRDKAQQIVDLRKTDAEQLDLDVAA